MTTDTKPKIAPKRPRRMAREPKPEVAATTDGATAVPPKRLSKTDLVLGLLRRPEGATIAQLVEATGWLPHTTRATLTGLKKKGHKVESTKLDGEERVYRVAVA